VAAATTTRAADHPDTAARLRNLAVLLNVQRELEAARPVYGRPRPPKSDARSMSRCPTVAKTDLVEPAESDRVLGRSHIGLTMSWNSHVLPS
jgi:hypothetical protein